MTNFGPVREHHPVVLAHSAHRAADAQLRVADAITSFAGSMPFVYIHAVVFSLWMLFVETDPWPKLTLVVSLEAIFLSTFVLISQNRMAATADKRADLDLQISLLAEHEITKLATLVSAIADHVGVKSQMDDELEEITEDVAPEAVLDEIEASKPAD